MDEKFLESMMSTASSSTSRETGQGNQTEHTAEVCKQSSRPSIALTVPSLRESLDRPAPSGESERTSRSRLPSAATHESPVTPGDATTFDTGECSKNENVVVSCNIVESCLGCVNNKNTSDTSITPPCSSSNTTSTSATPTVTSINPTSSSPSLSKPITSSATTTNALSRGPSSSSLFPRPPPPRPKMGLHHPTIGVNGHALPRGAGESRDAPRNPSALPTGPPDLTVRHRERLIGPVTACVALPPLRIADAQRERGRLVSVCQRLMSRPVKRRLWEVDHDKLGPEVEAEYKQMIEDDEKRFKERWEELGPEESKDSPSFYRSKVITPYKRRAAAAFPSDSAVATPLPALEEPVSTSDDKNAQKVSDASVSKPRTETAGAGTEKAPPSATTDDQKEPSDCPKDGSKQPATPSEVSSKKLVVDGQVMAKESVSSNYESESMTTTSSSDSPSSAPSTPASASKPGVSSSETTPTHTVTVSSPASDRPLQEIVTRSRSLASSQKGTAPLQRPVTRASRQQRSLQRSYSGPYSRKHLRM
ncbi:mucin-5AC-like [Macrobrachium nipponense]|uniref:mucin-5AC-like n=1 Tax=Macrobrachium nipponense TaxID=159736 RepID=UPI0030C83BD8